ncbi:MAG: Cna B-type domain-containing protein [Butyrivibrio sp.]|nr:Cna B-type domain-containing protein [Butyrivibrio sp.]
MKKISKALKRIVVVALIALLFMTAPVGKVYAKEYLARADIDMSMDRHGSLTITHRSVDDELMEGVNSQIYLVATIDKDGQYTITDEFKECFSDPDFFNDGFDYDSWKDCVQYEETSDSDILDKYIKAKSINPVKNGVSDNNGKTYYTGLALGVYYVHSDKIVKDEHTHSFVNFVYPVPILVKDKDTGVISPNYSPEAEPKKSRVKNDVVTHCSIQKQWNDGGYANRPASVVFEIYCDGELMETVTLSSSNNWYHEWQNPGAHEYTVREIGIADGYSSSISVYQKPGTHDFVYTCVNSRGGGDNPPPPPDNPPPDNPPPDNPPPTNPPSNPPGFPGLPAVLGAVRALPQVLGARRLPQTGQLWWPLPILVIAGIFFIVKGIKKNAKMKAQNN